MSSHHIVREKQEPALLILSLDNFDAGHLGQLLEWSPTVLAAAPAAEALFAAGIHIDYLLMGGDEEAPLQAGLQLIRVENEPLLTAAMNFLIDKEYPAVNSVTAQFSPELYLPYTTQITLIIFWGGQKFIAVKPGFEKWKPAGSKIYINHIPPDLVCHNLTETGNGNWVTATDGFIKLEFIQPYLFIAEDI